MSTKPNPTPSAERIEQRLREALQPITLEVIDESYLHQGHAGANGSGFGTHFRVRVTTHLFTGKSPVMRHRLVYDALHDFIEQGLHALAIETHTPV